MLTVIVITAVLSAAAGTVLGGVVTYARISKKNLLLPRLAFERVYPGQKWVLPGLVIFEVERAARDWAYGTYYSDTGIVANQEILLADLVTNGKLWDPEDPEIVAAMTRHDARIAERAQLEGKRLAKSCPRRTGKLSEYGEFIP